MRTPSPTSLRTLPGGAAFNVIPDHVSLGGTIRLTDTSLFDLLFSTLTLRVKEIALAYGCEAEVINRSGEKGLNSRGEEFTIFAFPPNVNSDAILDLGIDSATKMYGDDATAVLTGKRTGCEDFAFVSEIVPAAQFRIGTKHPDDEIGSGTGTQVRCCCCVRPLTRRFHPRVDIIIIA